MDAADVVIEYLRKKLKGARSERAERILKPPMEETPVESSSIAPEEEAELIAVLGEMPPEEEEEEE